VTPVKATQPSWLHVQDFCRVTEFLIEHELVGAVNVSAPGALPNRDFLREYRAAWGCRWAFRARLG